ncbi:unnamed protein product [Angiostrongylus costaricensis]|uniref:Transcriptional regulator n=1 Tax=Angiostrongylus costaricensis TaxID=334426 RepID=A0A0R3PDU9_ANGCS|nr:unnamed protein product [Angiostrongylus costaricensis]
MMWFAQVFVIDGAVAVWREIEDSVLNALTNSMRGGDDKQFATGNEECDAAQDSNQT